MKTIYVSTQNYRDYSMAPIEGWPTIPVEVDDNWSGGDRTYSPSTGQWAVDVMPPPIVETEPVPPTVEELMAQLAAIQEQLAALQQADNKAT